MEKKGLTYKDSGVDIEAGYETVKQIRKHVQSTYRPEVLADIGSFGGFFALDIAKYKNPVLVSGTDGVGTKLKIAFMADKHDTIGLDVVAYCVNDIICQGAEPLFFLDYLAVGKLDPAKASDIVKGVAEGCKQAGCSLIGGETAEMPGFYPDGEYDIAGFAVGVVDREKVVDGSKVQPGDKIIGIASSGLQSSGYSLVRKVIFEVAGYKVSDYVESLGKTIGEELLEPTRIYAKPILDLVQNFDVHGIANISGGGLIENIPRSLAAGTRAVVKKGTWETQPIFNLIMEKGGITEDEMLKTLNLGIGMVVIAPAAEAEAIVNRLSELGEKGYIIGDIVSGEKGIDII